MTCRHYRSVFRGVPAFFHVLGQRGVGDHHLAHVHGALAHHLPVAVLPLHVLVDVPELLVVEGRAVHHLAAAGRRDDDGERALAQSLMQLKQKGCTVVLISHRSGVIVLRTQRLHQSNSRFFAGRITMIRITGQ